MCKAAGFAATDGLEMLVSEGADVLESAGSTIKIKNMFGEKVQLGERIESF
jgi:phosphotransferase system IIA component